MEHKALKAILYLMLVGVCGIGIRQGGNEGDVSQRMRQIGELVHWGQHRQYLVRTFWFDRINVTHAYWKAFQSHKSPLLASGLCYCYRIDASLDRFRLANDQFPAELYGSLKSYLETKEAMACPSAVYERWLLITSSPPEFTGDEPVIGHSVRHHSDGSPARDNHGNLISIPILDGSVDVKRRDKLVRDLVVTAKSLDPNNPELAYMITYESPHDEKRYLRLGQIVAAHPDIFGYSGLHAVYRAAKELGKSEAASKWKSRCDAVLKQAYPLQRALLIKLYPE